MTQHPYKEHNSTAVLVVVVVVVVIVSVIPELVVAVVVPVIAVVVRGKFVCLILRHLRLQRNF